MNAEYQNPWKTARECAGLTQEAAAERIDVSVKSISYYETGARHMTPQIAAQLADAYHAPWLRNQYCMECPIGCDRKLPTELSDIRAVAVEAACCVPVRSGSALTGCWKLRGTAAWTLRSCPTCRRSSHASARCRPLRKSASF